MRPIAVGCSLRRLVTIVSGKYVRESITVHLSPLQLGFGIPLGAEAAVHAARKYLQDLSVNHSLLKLDFKNAFLLGSTIGSLYSIEDAIGEKTEALQT